MIARNFHAVPTLFRQFIVGVRCRVREEQEKSATLVILQKS